MSVSHCCGTRLTWNGCNVTRVRSIREVMRPKDAGACAVATAPVGALLVELYFDEDDTVHHALQDSVERVRRLTVRMPDSPFDGVSFDARLEHFTVILKPSDAPVAKLLFRPVNCNET